MPGQITRVILRFTDHKGVPDFYGRYPYHCHIIEHEDHEMMRQFQVVNLTCNNNGICERARIASVVRMTARRSWAISAETGSASSATGRTRSLS